MTVKDLEDHWAEREYVLKTHLARRQLNTAPRAELGLKLLEIERERARKRQQLSGQLYGRGKAPASQEEFLLQWVRSLREQAALEEAEKVSAQMREPITREQQSGKATEIVAPQLGAGSRTLEQAQAIQRVAAWADAWDSMLSVKPSWSQPGEVTARREVQTQAGRQFDPRLVGAFRELVSGSNKIVASFEGRWQTIILSDTIMNNEGF